MNFKSRLKRLENKTGDKLGEWSDEEFQLIQEALSPVGTFVADPSLRSRAVANRRLKEAMEFRELGDLIEQRDRSVSNLNHS